MEVIDLFPTALAKVKLASLNIDAALQHIKGYDYIYSPGDGGYTQQQSVLSDDFFTDVRAEIEEHCLAFSKMHGHCIDGVSVCNSWVNAVNPGQQVHGHIHTNSYISGCFYLTEGAPIEFYDKDINDQIFSFMPRRVSDPNNFRTWSSAYFNVEPGDLLLFPSRLYHSVRQHTGDYVRMSLAFNVVPRGGFGEDGRRMNIVALSNL